MKTNKKYSQLKKQTGLTLIEIIVVLVILSVLIAFLTNGLFGQAQGAKVKVTLMKMEKLKSAINQFQLMNNQLPTSAQSLVSCESKQGACVPVANEADLLDAWDTPMAINLSGNSYTVKSLGADKREGGSGTDGDITITGP